MLCKIIKMLSRHLITCLGDSSFKDLCIPKLATSYFSFYDCPEMFNRTKLRGIWRKVNTFVPSALNQLGKLTAFPVDRDHVKPFEMGVFFHFIHSFFFLIKLV